MTDPVGGHGASDEREVTGPASRSAAPRSPESGGAGPPIPASGGAEPRSAGLRSPGASGSQPADQLARMVEDLGLEAVREGGDSVLVTLPGERRRRTLVWLVVGTHQLLVESFVCRAPDENHLDVYRYILQRNAKLRTVAYALDRSGDIHLVGRLGLDGLNATELDTVLGVVLAASDADFNPILERGFATAIRREWAWRTSRGESAQNLVAFRHLIEAE